MYTASHNSFAKRFLSLLLTIIFVLSILPPLEIHASSREEGGEGNLRITSLSNGDEINGKERVKIKWNSVKGADHYWLTIKGTSINRDVGKRTTYTVNPDDGIFTKDNKEYKIYVAAMDEDGNVLNHASDWNAIYVTNVMDSIGIEVSKDEMRYNAKRERRSFTVTADTPYTITTDCDWMSLSRSSGSTTKSVGVLCEANTGAAREGVVTVTPRNGGKALTVTIYQEGVEICEPELHSVEAAVDGLTVTFTVEGNEDATHGIVLYADQYELDIDWKRSGSTYTGTHVFNQSGKRKIRVFPLDNEDYEIAEGMATSTIRLEEAQVLTAPVITTADGQTITAGEKFRINWQKLSSPANVTYNVYVWNGTKNVCVTKNPTANGYCNISQKYLEDEGTYAISVTAMAKNYQSAASNPISLTVVEAAEEDVIQPAAPVVPAPAPTVKPTGKPAKWKLQYSANTLDVVVSLKSGDLDASVNYLLVAEDAAGRHYSDTIPAGQTTASFRIKGLQLARGQRYSYYVVPEGISLVQAGKSNYYVGKSYVPLYGGDMITSVRTNGAEVAEKGTITMGSDVEIHWDGSYGVDAFQMTVKIDGKKIDTYTFSHSGPGIVTIPADKLRPGTLTATAKVIAPKGSGLKTASSSWKCTVVEAPVDERVIRAERMEKMTADFLRVNTGFYGGTDMALRKMYTYYESFGGFVASWTTAAATNPQLALEAVCKSVNKGSAASGVDLTIAKAAIASYVDSMCDDYYAQTVTDFLDVVVAFKDWADGTTTKDIRRFLDSSNKITDEAINIFVQLKGTSRSRINKNITEQIEKLLTAAMENPQFMEKVTGILRLENKKLDAAKAAEKISNAAHGFNSGLNSLMDALDTIGDFMEITKILNKDYSVRLIKLHALLPALESCSNSLLYEAAQGLLVQYENSLLDQLKELSSMGITKAAQKASGIWKLVTAVFSMVEENGNAAIRMIYIEMLDDALEGHITSLRDTYTETGDALTLQQLRLELHAMADCRAYINTLAATLNELFGFIALDSYALEILRDNAAAYHNYHSTIDHLLKA